ncbi:GmrSD restriction endonuclease domain-containing protein [Vibrio cholerae]|uniref:GmrSD restriction endonuclease domain-containing protein n=2 Tax=Vibrio cholerae TaxID=666 RepID=UPI000E0B43D6|nr:DUF262 domain-containing protein [Vibrio cholerae]EKF9996022.1 DUF262 domain-containing protein [Vibrio cholerae]EKG0021442.1 DUF262 domain-containing protein [Vibrio cholerae]MEE3775497.1 DUF262 domain-containing protein [Vibrio cholerae]
MDVYKGDAKFIIDYFQMTSSDFVIPEYQREYAWNAENVNQLFLDLRYGLSRIKISDTESKKKEEKSKFLGCVIQWNRNAKRDKDYHPSSSNYIDNIREIIDGQQRTSTIILILIRYYYYFEKKIKNLNSSQEEKIIAKHIKKEIQKSSLFNSFAVEIPPKGSNNYRPIIIRQESDKWSYDNKNAKYESPIASYIFNAIEAIKNKKVTKELSDIQSEDSNVREVIDTIDNEIAQMEEVDFDIVDNAFTIVELLGESFEEDLDDFNLNIKDYFDENEARKHEVYKIFNNISALRYLLKYCALTVISSPTEDSALDMFQSLNSSGVQLTALQMLKPILSCDFRNEGQRLLDSIVNDKINEINDWFNENSSTRDKKVKQFFLKFCMLLRGDVAPNSLSIQRSWVKSSYYSYTSGQTLLSKTEEYVEVMLSTKIYLDSFVLTSKKDLDDAPTGVYNKYTLQHPDGTSSQLSPRAITDLMYLRDANHDLHHSLLCRFFHQFRMTKTKVDKNSALQEFERIIKACASIFTSYRIIFNSHPDSFYKKLYSGYFSTLKNNTLTADKVITEFRKQFMNEVKIKFNNAKSTYQIKSALVESFTKNCKYKKPSTPIVKYVLLNYSHLKVGGNTAGLLKNGNKGNDVLRPEIWKDENIESVEHICPQASLNNEHIDYWGRAFLSSTKVNDIGNLTLLSLPNNQSTPEDTKGKLECYRALTSPCSTGSGTKVVASSSLSSATQYHLLPIVERLEKWVIDVEKQGVSPELSDYAWDAKFIDLRSRNIAKLSIRNFLRNLR